MDIRQYMEAEGCGLIEAKIAVTKLNKIEQLERLQFRCLHSIDSVSSILSDLIAELIEDAKA